MLNPKEFKIINMDMREESLSRYCKRLIEKWTPQMETEMLEAFIRLYHDEMYEKWEPGSKNKKKGYWPEIKSTAELLKYTGTDVTIYALKNAVYERCGAGNQPYKLTDVPICVILRLECPWDKEHGWAAVFIDEKFIKVGRDIVDCVWLD